MTCGFCECQTQSTSWVHINGNTIQQSPPLSFMATHILLLGVKIPLISCFTFFSRFQSPSKVFLSPFDINGKWLLSLRIFLLHVDLLSACAPLDEKPYCNIVSMTISMDLCLICASLEDKPSFVNL